MIATISALAVFGLLLTLIFGIPWIQRSAK